MKQRLTPGRGPQKAEYGWPNAFRKPLRNFGWIVLLGILAGMAYSPQSENKKMEVISLASDSIVYDIEMDWIAFCRLIFGFDAYENSFHVDGKSGGWITFGRLDDKSSRNLWTLETTIIRTETGCRLIADSLEATKGASKEKIIKQWEKEVLEPMIACGAAPQAAIRFADQCWAIEKKEREEFYDDFLWTFNGYDFEALEAGKSPCFAMGLDDTYEVFFTFTLTGNTVTGCLDSAKTLCGGTISEATILEGVQREFIEEMEEEGHVWNTISVGDDE